MSFFQDLKDKILPGTDKTKEKILTTVQEVSMNDEVQIMEQALDILGLTRDDLTFLRGIKQFSTPEDWARTVVQVEEVEEKNEPITWGKFFSKIYNFFRHEYKPESKSEWKTQSIEELCREGKDFFETIPLVKGGIKRNKLLFQAALRVFFIYKKTN